MNGYVHSYFHSFSLFPINDFEYVSIEINIFKENFYHIKIFYKNILHFYIEQQISFLKFVLVTGKFNRFFNY